MPAAAKKPALTTAQKLRAKQTEAKKLREALQALSNNVLLYLAAVDETMRGPEGRPRGERIAQLCNSLDMANDNIRFSHLDVDYRKDDKAQVVANLRQGSTR